MRFDHDDYGLRRIYARNFVDRREKCTSQSRLKGPIVSCMERGGTGVSSSSS
jgi:hypothetical protein